MISNINNISYFLQTLERFKTKRGLRKRNLYSFIKIPPSLLVYSFDYDEIFELGLNLNLFKEENGVITLTRHGLSLIEMSQSGLDLTDEQIKYIAQNCIFNNKKFANIINFFKHFVFYEKKKTYIISDENAMKYSEIVGILFQFNVIQRLNNLWTVNADYFDHVEQIRRGIRKIMTQQQLDDIIREQKAIGNLAEKLTLKYEMQRLNNQKLIFESNNVKKISDKYVNRGYDIESFSCKSKEPNLFIEVKGRKYNTMSFIISMNEIKTAEVLGDKYVIYFWNELGSTIKPKEPLRIILDPFKELPFAKCENCLNYLVQI